ncbi:MAG: potassium channel family protein [Reyranellaceae bacterium]
MKAERAGAAANGGLAHGRRVLRQLYEGHTPRAQRFRYGILAFDLCVFVFIVATSFVPHTVLIETIDFVLGLIILVELCARVAASRRPRRELLRPTTWTDCIAITSFLLPLLGEAVGFLRVLRTLRLLRAYETLARLRLDSRFFQRNEETILALANLVVFIFILTAAVYETQRRINQDIANFVDALYFTVATLTTTGFGDIVLRGTWGRLLSVAIMLCGVTLFFNLARALISPPRVRFPCPTCGLQRHDFDAVHCKACGTPLKIPDEGFR